MSGVKKEKYKKQKGSIGTIKLTPRMIKVISNYIRKGVTRKIASVCAGITNSTFTIYMENARIEIDSEGFDPEDCSIFVDLYNAVEKAQYSYYSHLYEHESKHIFELDNPNVLMNAMKCRLPETHNPASIQHNLDIPVDIKTDDPAEIVRRIREDVSNSNE